MIKTALHVAFCILLLTMVSCTSSSKETRPDLYRGQGVASWYGSEFHGKPTSSGEAFNMHAYTCAHREYPFGTKVRVTNPANNKSVECTVNDRGPLVGGRDIDLSYASAKEIGLLGMGTTGILFEVLGRDSSYIRNIRVQAARGQGPFVIQVGSFSERENAIRLKAALSSTCSNVYIQEVQIKGTTFYRVRIGNYESLNEAVSTAERLGQEGYPTLVLRAEVKM